MSDTKAPWSSAFVDLAEEHGFRPMRLEGRLPPDLHGTLWSNGSAVFSDVPEGARMWLDGDGAVNAVRIEDGTVKAAVRRVLTTSIQAERRAQRRLNGRYHLRPSLTQHLGELFAGRPRRNAGNTSVWLHRDRVFALCPSGLPVELSAADLSTIGEVTFDGVVDGGFSAHASYSTARAGFYNFGFRFGRSSTLDLYFFPDQGAPSRIASVPIAGPMFNHDFMVTDRWAIFLLAPARVDPLPMLLGQPLGRCLGWRPEEGTEVVLVSLDARGAANDVVRFTIDPIVVLHYANAWEETSAGGQQEIVLHAPVGHDFMRTWRWLEGLAKGEASPCPDPVLTELRIDPKARRLTISTLTDVVSEAPRVCPRFEMQRQRWVYGNGFRANGSTFAGLPDRLVKIDTRSGDAAEISAGPETHPSEAVFVPRAGGKSEDDGWLLSLVFDARANETCLAVFAADVPDAPPIARAWLGQVIPPTFHGTWKGRGDKVGGGVS